MNGFYQTPKMKAKRRKIRIEMALLQLKKKIFGSLSEADEKRFKEILRELSIHY